MGNKICFIASSGGHFEQLMMLRPLMDKYDSFLVTEKTLYSTKVSDYKTYYLKQTNRRELAFLFNFSINFIKSVKIILNEKPTIIISTGALSAIPMCILGKIFKRKVIFIESFAKVNSPTLTGKLLYKWVDQFYVQWESMLEVYPKATYKGAIY